MEPNKYCWQGCYTGHIVLGPSTESAAGYLTVTPGSGMARLLTCLWSPFLNKRTKFGGDYGDDKLSWVTTDQEMAAVKIAMAMLST